MLTQLSNIKKRFTEVKELLAQKKMAADPKEYVSLQKEYKKLSSTVAQIARYEQNEKMRTQNLSLLQTEKDPDLLALAKEEKAILETEANEIENTLKAMLLPKDPHEDKNIILELRAGTGGEEAALWVGDLFRMYQRFADSKKWKVEVLSFIEGASGGYKEIICHVVGKKTYSFMQYESGIHRVQRVPSTDTQGRIHTSAASVVVLPEMDEVEVNIDMSEVKKETFCSSGPGGQSVNTTYSAVRLTHLPTGITVSCQDGKSQIKNLEKALKVLRARLYERAFKEQQSKIEQDRRAIVGSGDRSAKIRTYNYPRSWVNDHRINYTQQGLDRILNGDLGELIEALRLAHNSAILAGEKAKVNDTTDSKKV